MKNELRWVAAFTATMTFLACSSGEDTTTEIAGLCADHTTLAAVPSDRKPVSFTDEILPVFARSCAFPSCHGNGSASHGVFLGSRGGSDPAAVRKGLVDRPSTALPRMALVAPGAPGDSFLMRKLDDDLCGLDADCTGGSCGERMPRGGAPLDDATRAKVRAWIEQGASD